MAFERFDKPMAKIRLPPSAQELYDRGVISIDVHFSHGSYEMWARANQPHPRLQVFPHQSYRVEEIADLLAKVVKGSSGVPTPKSPPSPTMSRNGMIKRGNVLNQAPSDSLVYEDFDDQRRLITRIGDIAAKLGAAKAVGRISSNGNILGIPSVSNLGDWWNEADGEQRFMLLSSRSRQGSRKEIWPGLNTNQAAIMMGCRCPFRGTEALMEKKAESPSPSYSWAEERFEEEGEEGGGSDW